MAASRDEELALTDEGHWAVLSALRFVLAFQVMLFHTSHGVFRCPGFEFFGAFAPVAGFFVISGFSIAHSLARHPSGFLLRRFRRIYPLSLAGILIAVCLTWISGGAMPDRGAVLATMLLLNGILVATPSVLSPYWSLSCEWTYYLLAPWLNRRPVWIVAGAFGLSLAAYAIPLFVWRYPVPVPIVNHGEGHVRLLWLWLLGYLAYRCGRHPVILLLLVGGGIATVSSDGGGNGSLLVFLGAVWSIWNFGRFGMPARFVKCANYLGELSYPLYLVHYPAINFIKQFASQWGMPMVIAACWTSALLLSIAAYHLIDVPLRKRRHHPQPL